MITHLASSRSEILEDDDLRRCLDVLKSSGVIAFPTDTVYGLGCNAFSVEAIKRIYSLKGRLYNKPLPILLASANQLSLVAQDIPREAAPLIEEFWPGPLTLVVKTAPILLHASRGRQTVAVRVPDHGIVRRILDEFQLPITATSANKSGQPSVKSGADVRKQFKGKIEFIIDGGKCRVGKESSVVDVTHYPFTVLREGAVSKERLLACLEQAPIS